MSFVLLGILNSQAAGGAGGPYRFQIFSASSSTESNVIKTDSSNNVFLAGRVNDASFSAGAAYLTKLDSDNQVVFTKTLSNQNNIWTDLKIRGSSEIAIVGTTQEYGNVASFLAKYDLSGNLIWQRGLHGNTIGNLEGVDFDSIGNIYVAGMDYDDTLPSFFDYLFVKYATSGTLAFQLRLFTNNFEQDQANGLVVDSNDNVYIAGLGQLQAPDILDAQIFKLTTGGSVVWQRALGANAGSFEAVTTDSSDNIYAVGKAKVDPPADNENGILTKWDSSGNLIWERGIQVVNGTSTFRGVTVDSQGSIIVVGAENTNADGALVFKYDSSGNLVWQRKISTGANGVGAYGVSVDSSDDIYVTFNAGGLSPSNSHLVAYIPSDGSRTGEYSLGTGTITYEASAISVFNFSHSQYTLNYSVGTRSLNNSVATQTDGSFTFTTSEILI